MELRRCVGPCLGMLAFLGFYVLVLGSFLEARRIASIVVDASLYLHVSRLVESLDLWVIQNKNSMRRFADLLDLYERAGSMTLKVWPGDISELGFQGCNNGMIMWRGVESCYVFSCSGPLLRVIEGACDILDLGSALMPLVHHSIPINGAGSGDLFLMIDVGPISRKISDMSNDENFQFGVFYKDSLIAASARYEAWGRSAADDSCMNINGPPASRSMFALINHSCARGFATGQDFSVKMLISDKFMHKAFISQFIAALSMSSVMSVALLLIVWVFYHLVMRDAKGIMHAVDAIALGRYDAHDAMFAVFVSISNRLADLYCVIHGLRTEVGRMGEELIRMTDNIGRLAAIKKNTVRSNKDIFIKYNESRCAYDDLRIRWHILNDQYEFCKAENDKLASLSRQKSEFLANISHEILTPLNAMLGFAEVLRQENHLDGVRKIEYINHIHDSGRYMAALMRTFLDFAKAEYGIIVLKENDVDLRVLVAECVAMAEQIRDDVPVMVDLAPNAHIINADALRLKQALSNLLVNAIKFSTAGQPVTILSRVVPPCIEIVVTDTGIGIAKEDVPKVMKMFGQANPEQGDSGAGMGLAISKRIIEMHGGMLKIYSEVGRGTSAVMELPILRLRRFVNV